MGIYFGALSDPLKIQMGFDSKEVKHLQKDADAVTRLLIRSIITGSQGNQARKRIMKNIEKVMRKKIGV